MAEFIEKEGLLANIASAQDLRKLSTRTIGEALSKTPTVTIIRCYECKYLMFSDFYGECSIGHMGIVSPSDYCSRAVKK